MVSVRTVVIDHYGAVESVCTNPAGFSIARGGTSDGSIRVEQYRCCSL